MVLSRHLPGRDFNKSATCILCKHYNTFFVFCLRAVCQYLVHVSARSAFLQIKYGADVFILARTGKVLYHM